MTSNSVIVSEDVRKVQWINPATNAAEQLGELVSRVYQGERVQRHHYVGTDHRGNPKTYNLGPTTDRFHFVNHDAIIRPFLEEGYEIVRAEPIKGGLDMWVQMTPPNAATFADMIRWDEKLWPSPEEMALKRSVLISTSVRPGKAIVAHEGWLRLICTNGLVAEVLKLGGFKMNHQNFSMPKIRAFAAQSGKSQINPKHIMGPYVGNKRAADRLANIIDLQLVQGSDSEYALEDRLNEDLPAFIVGMVRTLADLPQWYLQDLAVQLQLMVQNMEGDRIHALDAVNAITNPINRAPQAMNPARILMQVPALAKTTSNLLGAMSM